MTRIYLDNAATSFPKPEAVYAAVDDYNRRLGAAAGRGGYRESVEVDGVIRRCRKRAATILGAETPEQVVFTFNATDSLNTALHGLLSAGDHVVTSRAEHNSVLRPLRELETRRGVEVTRVDVDEDGRADPDAFARALRPKTRLVCLQHASNVTGVLQPIERVGQIARQAGAVFLVDAAQSAGHHPIDLSDLPVDLLACAGHKGLLGPLGTGLLYIGPEIESSLAALRQGGTGSQSESDVQPELLPDRFESGNLNAPALFGLDAALGWLEERTIESIAEHECELTGRLLERLAGHDGVRIVGPAAVDGRLGVVSITAEGYEPTVLATVLDQQFGIQVRAGLHCAPGAHAAAGTLESGGTIRFSVGPFTTEDDVDAAAAAVGEICGASRVQIRGG